MKKLLVLIAFGTLAGCSLYFGNDTPGSGGGGGGGGGNPGFGCTSNTDCAAGCYCATADGATSGTCEEGGFCTTDADCGTGFHCDTMRSSCEPNPPQDPAGSCGGTVTCTTAPPQCPAGQVAGITDGCYSGLCRDIAGCDVPPACTSYQHEMDCLGDQTCGANYTGINCHHTDGSACHAGDAGCTCDSFVFHDCSSKTAGARTVTNSQGIPVDITTLFH